jgi:elongation factor Ts
MSKQPAPGLGKIGVLIGLNRLETPASSPPSASSAMHVAAANPQSLDISSVDPAALERERNVLAEQARTSGKAEEIIAKMVEGRLRKYYEEVVLLEQVYVIDGESRVKAAVAAAAKEVGAPIAVTGFHRMVLGEGIQREQKDFAAEVAAQLGS